MRMSGALLAGLALAGCSMKQDMAAADQGVASFHHLLDAGQVDAIYAQAATEMKAAPDAAGLVPILAAVHRKLGNVTSSVQQGFNDNINTSGHFASLAYKTQFERGAAEESFTFKIDGGKAILVGYHINSPALILS